MQNILDIFFPFLKASDRDLCPDYDDFEETARALEDMTSYALEQQKQNSVRLMNFGCDLFSHPRYMNGAATSPDSLVYAYACAQVKRGIEAAKKLGAENFVFFHPRDGYQSLLQRQVFRDLGHLAQFYKMAVQFKEKIGYRGQFLIQPKPFDPRRCQYESDAATTLHLLKNFNLERNFKLYIKPGWSRMMGRKYEHDVHYASAFKMLGAVDASDNWQELNSSSDVCPFNVRDATYIMKCIVEQVTFALANTFSRNSFERIRKNSGANKHYAGQYGAIYKYLARVLFIMSCTF